MTEKTSANPCDPRQVDQWLSPFGAGNPNVRWLLEHLSAHRWFIDIDGDRSQIDHPGGVDENQSADPATNWGTPPSTING